MDKIKITGFHFYSDPDLSELDLELNQEKPQAASVIHANENSTEPFRIDLRFNPESKELVGATILYSANLFQELARAFAEMDLNHPDVRFFLEKKLELYAERHRDELQPQAEPVLP